MNKNVFRSKVLDYCLDHFKSEEDHDIKGSFALAMSFVEELTEIHKDSFEEPSLTMAEKEASKEQIKEMKAMAIDLLTKIPRGLSKSDLTEYLSTINNRLTWTVLAELIIEGRIGQPEGGTYPKFILK